MPTLEQAREFFTCPSGNVSDILINLGVILADSSQSGSPDPEAQPLYVSPKQYSGDPSNYTVIEEEGFLFNILPGEYGFVQNLQMSPVKLARGFGASSLISDAFTEILNPPINDGEAGGHVKIDDYIGPVYAISVAGGGVVKLVAWKMTL